MLGLPKPGPIFLSYPVIKTYLPHNKHTEEDPKIFLNPTSQIPENWQVQLNILIYSFVFTLYHGILYDNQYITMSQPTYRFSGIDF